MNRNLFKADSIILGAVMALAFAGPCFADEAASPGPALEARQKLLERIQQARSQGMGIGGYMQAFKALEDQVKAGDGEDKISARVQQIHKAVSDQMDRAKVLKTQKPLPPQGSQITGSDPIAPQSPSGGRPSAPPAGAGAGGGGGDMISKLKDKFGDKLNNLPDGIKERLMNNPDAQNKIMEKIRERGGGDGPGPGGPGGPPPGGNSSGRMAEPGSGPPPGGQQAPVD